MSQTITINGNFVPLTNKQLSHLKALHERYPNKKIILNKPSDPYYEKIDKEILKYKPYCSFAKSKLDKWDYDFHFLDEDLHLATLYHFPSLVAKRIYRDILPLFPLLEEILPAKRYQHCLSTAQVAKDLALIHHVNTNKAYLAGLLHDCLKNYSAEQFDEILKYYDPQHLTKPLKTKHSFAAYYFLKHQALLCDNDILNAIYHHTYGTSRTKLAMIVYIADKREPLRKINDNILPIAKKNLYQAFELLKEDVAKYIKEHNGQ